MVTTNVFVGFRVKILPSNSSKPQASLFSLSGNPVEMNPPLSICLIGTERSTAETDHFFTTELSIATNVFLSCGSGSHMTKQPLYVIGERSEPLS